MKNVLKSRFLWTTTLLVALGFGGCNIFNPTESVNITNDDADALTYEGYLKFRKNEYTEAAYYFNKAIAADSSHSEAWFGLIKAKMNSEGLNAFNLLKYANAKRSSSLPLSDMPDSEADSLKNAIDTVYQYATLFKEYDSQGKLDGEKTMTNKSVADGYMVLQVLNTMLILRKTTTQMDGCHGEKNNCDMGEVLNNLKSDPEEVIGSFHEIFSTCENNPSSMSDWFGQFVDEWESVDETITEDAQTNAFKGMCLALAQQTEYTDDPDEQEKTVNIISSQLGYSSLNDDDGDGCVDEELYDGEDNDGDGAIDEDMRNKTNQITYDSYIISQNTIRGKNSTKDLLVISEARPNAKYSHLDIDMDGRIYAKDNNYTEEWDYIYKNYKDRNSHSYMGLDGTTHTEHRLVFAKNISFNPQGLPFDQFIALKKAVANDTDPQNFRYSLEDRKNLIGGCWVYYNDKTFNEWFMGRK